MTLLAPLSYGDRFRDLIGSLTGIILPANKVQMIDQRLRRRVLAFGLPDTEAYLRMLLEDRGMTDELRIVIDLITTNTTSFFREPSHFDFLVDEVLPATLGRRGTGSAPRLKLWSAASSEGAEAFTAAMVLAEAQRAGRRFDYAILGTDISSQVLERATAAVYGIDQLNTVPPPLRRRYFMTSADPALSGKARVVPELRRRVRFRHLNLMDDAYPVDRDVDVILLRNVLIYFSAEDKDRVIAKMVRHVAPGGYLLVGHSESMAVRHPGLRQIRPTIFRKE
nr:protein-glutamate O-methyltransferase [Paracoccus saliphilus]